MRMRRVAVSIAVVTAFLFSACSDGGGAPEASSEATAEPITLGFSAWPGWFPWQVADEQGLFEDAGLDVDLKYFESYTDSLNALNTGQIDANTQTLNDTISSIAAGTSEKIVLVNDNSTGNDQIIVKPGIEEIADLKGKTIGIEEGTVDHFLLLLGLEKAGLGPDDVTIKPLLTDAAAAAFSSGQLDAVGVFAPFTTTALELEGSKALFTSKDFPGSIPDHLVIGDELTGRPDDVQKLIDVWFTTLEWIDDNHDEAVKIMAKRAGVTVAEYEEYDAGTTLFSVEDNIEAFSDGDDMKHLPFAAEEVATFLVDAGLLDEAPDLEGLLDGSYVAKHAAENAGG